MVGILHNSQTICKIGRHHTDLRLHVQYKYVLYCTQVKEGDTLHQPQLLDMNTPVLHRHLCNVDITLTLHTLSK